MGELDKLEEYLKSNEFMYKRQPVFAGMPKGPEQIAVYDGMVQVWNVVCDGLLEYSGPDGLQGGLTAGELIERIEE